MPRRHREDARLDTEGWSRWVRGIVPEKNGRVVGRHRQHFERRSDDQQGLLCTNIREALPDEMSECGIYEWQARRPRRGTRAGHRNVVYVGSTCRAKPGALRDRILEYCVSGSHKSENINDALQRGYELWVRVKTSGRSSDHSREAAGNMENKLLERYDYAWNFRNNGKRRIRQILR